MSIRGSLLALAVGCVGLRTRRSPAVPTLANPSLPVASPNDERGHTETYNRYILAVLAATLVGMSIFATMAHDMLRGIHPGRSQAFLSGLGILVLSQVASPFAFVEKRLKWKRRLLVAQIGALVAGCYAMVLAVFFMTMDVAAGHDLPYCVYSPLIVSKAYQPTMTDQQRAEFRKYVAAHNLMTKTCPTVNDSLDDGSLSLP
jgi:hypothetical protein